MTLSVPPARRILAVAALTVLLVEDDRDLIEELAAFLEAAGFAVTAAETIRELLDDPDITGDDLISVGERRSAGVGVIEAPLRREGAP